MTIIWGEWLIHGRPVSVQFDYRWSSFDYGWNTMEVVPIYVSGQLT